jgi:hypothetical protein
MRAVTPCGTLWTLHRDGHTRSAEIRHVAAGGLELRFMRDGTLTIWRLFRDGADLLNDSSWKLRAGNANAIMRESRKPPDLRALNRIEEELLIATSEPDLHSERQARND